MIINKTPFRISFFGGGSDFPEYFNEQPATVISSSINKYCYTSLKRKIIQTNAKYKFSYSIIDEVNHIEDIEHPVIKACLKHFKIDDPLEIHYDADLPGRSGIGSSSSFTVGLLHSLSTLIKHSLSRDQLALDAIMIEREMLKENVGYQDQYAASFGGFNKIIFSKNDTKVIPLDISMRDLISDYLVLFYYPKTRLSSNIQEAHVKNIQSNIETLNHMNKLSEEALVAIDNKDIKVFGNLLNESWNYKKALTKEVSNKDIDDIYSIAMQNGALGGKISGAGGGGFMYFLCEPELQNNFIKKMEKLQHIDCSLSSKGSEIIYEKQN
tara:strand:+ start:11966 stop:12940 length:975 start_codon:yes stop_codon:yes gene_type:complete